MSQPQDDIDSYKDFVSQHWMMVQISWNEDHLFYAVLPKSPFFNDEEEIHPVREALIVYNERSCPCVIIAISNSRDQIVQKFHDIKRWYRESVLWQARQSTISQEYRRITNARQSRPTNSVGTGTRCVSFSEDQISFLHRLYNELKNNDHMEEVLAFRVSAVADNLLRILETLQDIPMEEDENSDEANDDGNDDNNEDGNDGTKMIPPQRDGEQQFVQAGPSNPYNGNQCTSLFLKEDNVDPPRVLWSDIVLPCGKPLEEVAGDMVHFGTYRTAVNFLEYTRLEWHKPLKTARTLIEFIITNDSDSRRALVDRPRKVSGIGWCHHNKVDPRKLHDLVELMEKKCGLTESIVRELVTEKFSSRTNYVYDTQMEEHHNRLPKWELFQTASQEETHFPTEKRICKYSLSHWPPSQAVTVAMARSPSPPIVAQPLPQIDYALNLSIVRVSDVVDSEPPCAYSYCEQDAPLDFSFKSEAREY